MTKGIVIKGARDTKIEKCDFINLDVAVEAENSQNLQLHGNRIIDRRIKTQKGKQEK